MIIPVFEIDLPPALFGEVHESVHGDMTIVED
jgi:hypothetical protein